MLLHAVGGAGHERLIGFASFSLGLTWREPNWEYCCLRLGSMHVLLFCPEIVTSPVNFQMARITSTRFEGTQFTNPTNRHV